MYVSTVRRREEILKQLQHEHHAVSASKLASRFDVSRQVIVGDIALLRAEGHDILSTPRGYVIPNSEQKDNIYIGKVVCLHKADQTEQELQIIIDNGGEVLDVSVDHPLYGSLTGELRVANRYDINEFLKKMNNNQSKMLASLTNGVHTHTIHCENEEAFNRIKSELENANILYS